MKEVAFIFFLLSTGDQKEDLEHDGQARTSEPHLMPRRWFGFLLGNLWMIFGVRSDWRGTAFQAAPMGNEIRLRPWQRGMEGTTGRQLTGVWSPALSRR